MQKLLSIFVYLILLIFLESAAEVTGVPASAPAELPEEPSYVAITFDDGPRRGTTARLLDGLRERGASATFFLVGERLAGNEDLVLRMQAEGHLIGNHTYHHCELTALSTEMLLPSLYLFPYSNIDPDSGIVPRSVRLPVRPLFLHTGFSTHTGSESPPVPL